MHSALIMVRMLTDIHDWNSYTVQSVASYQMCLLCIQCLILLILWIAGSYNCVNKHCNVSTVPLHISMSLLHSVHLLINSVTAPTLGL